MERLNYTQSAASGRARRGVVTTRKGPVDTPAFMPVGTQGTVKGMMPEEVSDLGAQIILGNTYHLMIRPGPERVASLGGLHKMMDWKGSILTDSGGFQVFSLAGLRKVSEEGAEFRSHLDGKLFNLSPETCIQAQENLGSDIMMMLDECPPPGSERSYLEKSLARDRRWAGRALNTRTENGGALFGIIQGGVHFDLRKQSLEAICELPMDGFALGGLSVGEPKEEMMETIDRIVPLLPPDKPVYLMGVGEPVDLVSCAGLGVDMFDCVLPTRMARNGTLLSPRGRINLRNARWTDEKGPVDLECTCSTCQRFSAAYLRHLFMAKELLAYRLATVHNLHYILNLMAGLRAAIEQDKYQQFARDFFAKLEEGDAERDNTPQGGKNA